MLDGSVYLCGVGEALAEERGLGERGVVRVLSDLAARGLRLGVRDRLLQDGGRGGTGGRNGGTRGNQRGVARKEGAGAGQGRRGDEGGSCHGAEVGVGDGGEREAGGSGAWRGGGFRCASEGCILFTREVEPGR